MAEGVEVECPICDVVLGRGRSFTCSRCGLWWVQGDPQERLSAPDHAPGATAELRLDLAEPWRLGSLGCLLALLGFGGALGAALWSLRGGVPLWLGVLVSLPLGVLIVAVPGLLLAQYVVQRLAPSRLDGDSRTAHLRIWQTWGGLLDAFRRTDARIPRDQLVGVAVSRSQGGAAQLFLVHRSGLHCYAGFTGARGRVNELGATIQRWLGTTA